MTETTGAAFRAIGHDESLRWGSVGKLAGNCEARIVDQDTGNALPPGKQGELWIRGPIVMKGEVRISYFSMHNEIKRGEMTTNASFYLHPSCYRLLMHKVL